MRLSVRHLSTDFALPGANGLSMSARLFGESMIRILMGLTAAALLCSPIIALADNVIDWNATVRHVIQNDGGNIVNMANPGWSTRAMAMTNGAIYDVFQAFNRTNAPF